MKLLAINGSHRGDKGHTRHLLDLLFQGASEAGAECEIVTLAKHKDQPLSFLRRMSRSGALSSVRLS